MNIDGQSHDDEMDDGGNVKVQGSITTDEFLQIIDQSVDWITTYVALDEISKLDIYHGILLKIDETLRKNDVNRFELLNDVIIRLNETLNDDELTLKYAYTIIVSACKYNPEIIKRFLEKIVETLNKKSASAEVHENFFDSHKLLYYAIRSNDVDLLEALMESINSMSTNFYDSLAKSYESLRSKNVDIDETMKIFVEDRLIRERFLRDVTGARDASSSGLKNAAPEVDVCRIINFLIDAVKMLSSITSFDHQVSIALFTARLIRVLKGHLKSTVNQRPWTEMEFCLLLYSRLSSVGRKKLHRRLASLIDEPKRVFGITDTSGDDHEALGKIKDYVNGDSIIDWEKVDDFEAFHDDYELLKDEYSLKKILRYVESSLSVRNPESQRGKLIIQRTLHVIGEHVKNSLASPNLSVSAQENFIGNFMGGAIEIAPSLRDSLSHVEELHVLFLRNSVENQRGFFTQLQEDLKKAHGAIIHVSCCARIKRFKRWCDEIVSADDTQEFQNLCREFLDYLHGCKLPDVEDPDINPLTKAEVLLMLISEEIKEDEEASMGNFIRTQIAKIQDIIASEKCDVSTMIMDFNKTLTTMRSVIVGHLKDSFKKCSNVDASKGVTEKSRMVIKNLSHVYRKSSNDRPLKRLREINSLLDSIDVNVEESSRNIRDMICHVKQALFSNSYLLKFSAIEEFKEKIKILGSAVPNCTAEEELDEAFKMATSVLRSEETIRQFRSSLEKKKMIHEIKLKVGDQLTEPELRVLHELRSTKRSEGQKLLSKTPDYYGEFLAGKREMKKFAGSFLSENKSVRSKVIDLFDLIKSQLAGCTPEIALIETIREIEEKNLLTREEFDYLTDRFKVIDQDHQARSNLANFFNCTTELEKVEYERCVASLNANAKLKTDLLKLQKSMSTSFILESLTDSYGALVTTVKNRGSTAEQICNSYINFLVSLKLDPETRTLLTRAIIKKKILRPLEAQFFQKLNCLRNILGDVKTRRARCISIARYRIDPKFQATVEMLLLDLCNISKVADAVSVKCPAGSNEIPLKCLERGFLHLDGNLPFLTENSFRNYLAHGDALIDSLSLLEPTIAVISCAIIFTEEAESLVALRDLVKGEKMAIYLFNQEPNTLHQLHSEGRFNLESWWSFRRSKYRKRYLQNGPWTWKSASAGIDLSTCCEEYLSRSFDPSPLFAAASAGNQDDLQALLARGEEIRVGDQKMRTLLHVVAREGHEDLVEILLENGINIDAVDEARRTPLHLAVRKGHGPMVEKLLQKGAKVNARDANGCTPLHVAALLLDTSEVAQILLDHQADRNARCAIDLSPLDLAAMRGNLEVIKLLLEDLRTSDVIADDWDQMSLRSAIQGNHNKAEVFEYLLDNCCQGLDCEGNVAVALFEAVCTVNHNAVEAILKKMTPGEVSQGDMEFMLERAAVTGNVDMVQVLLNNGAKVNDLLTDGTTALHVAAMCGHSGLAEFLIERGAEVDARRYDDDGTPLHVAAMNGYLETVKVLVEVGKADVNIPAVGRTTALHFAITHPNIVKYLVAHGAYGNPLDDDGRSLLHFWADLENSEFEVADYLIDELKIDVEGRTNYGCTPLVWVVICEGTFNTVEYFVDRRKARIDVRDDHGKTLLHHAVERRNFRLVEYFMEKMGQGVQEILEARDDSGCNVLQTAVELGHTKIVKRLLETRNDESFVDAYDHQLRTPLHYAIELGRTSLVEALLERGADVDARRNPLCSPLNFAIFHGHKTIVRILLKHGAGTERKTGCETSPLLLACCRYEPDIVDVLLEADADVNSADRVGQTPLHVAAYMGNLDIAAALLKRGALVDAVDDGGTTPMQCAYQVGNMDVYELLVDSLLNG